ncbi:MAG: DUF3397 family protein [Vulcanibacillus sp.]
MDYIVKLYALLATVPIISFLLFAFIINFFIKSKKSSMIYSIYLTNILLISCVSAQINILFNFSYSFIIVLVLIIIIITSLAFLQFKIRGKISYTKLLTSASKLFFILFNTIFFILFVIIFTKS